MLIGLDAHRCTSAPPAHKVSTRFDVSDVIRRLYGEKDLKIFRDSEDPNDIAVLFEWNEPVKAVHYSQSEELRSAMKKAGVLGEPKVYLSNEDLKS